VEHLGGATFDLAAATLPVGVVAAVSLTNSATFVLNDDPSLIRSRAVNIS